MLHAVRAAPYTDRGLSLIANEWRDTLASHCSRGA